MRATQHQMKTVYGAKYCSLHVRVTNEAAIALYAGVLGYEKNSVAEKYYADGEDAFDMCLYFDKSVRNEVRKKGKEGKLIEEVEDCSTKSCCTSKVPSTVPSTAASTAAPSEAGDMEGGQQKKKNKKKKKKKGKGGQADTGEA